MELDDSPAGVGCLHFVWAQDAQGEPLEGLLYYYPMICFHKVVQRVIRVLKTSETLLYYLTYNLSSSRYEDCHVPGAKTSCRFCCRSVEYLVLQATVHMMSLPDKQLEQVLVSTE